MNEELNRQLDKQIKESVRKEIKEDTSEHFVEEPEKKSGNPLKSGSTKNEIVLPEKATGSVAFKVGNYRISVNKSIKDYLKLIEDMCKLRDDETLTTEGKNRKLKDLLTKSSRF